MGATRDGYCSDMTRMLFLGDPGAKVKRIYRVVLEAQYAPQYFYVVLFTVGLDN